MALNLKKKEYIKTVANLKTCKLKIGPKYINLSQILGEKSGNKAPI